MIKVRFKIHQCEQSIWWHCPTDIDYQWLSRTSGLTPHHLALLPVLSNVLFHAISRCHLGYPLISNHSTRSFHRQCVQEDKQQNNIVHHQYIYRLCQQWDVKVRILKKFSKTVQSTFGRHPDGKQLGTTGRQMENRWEKNGKELEDMWEVSARQIEICGLYINRTQVENRWQMMSNKWNKNEKELRHKSQMSSKC